MVLQKRKTFYTFDIILVRIAIKWYKKSPSYPHTRYLSSPVYRPISSSTCFTLMRIYSTLVFNYLALYLKKSQSASIFPFLFLSYAKAYSNIFANRCTLLPKVELLLSSLSSIFLFWLSKFILRFFINNGVPANPHWVLPYWRQAHWRHRWSFLLSSANWRRTALMWGFGGVLSWVIETWVVRRRLTAWWAGCWWRWSWDRVQSIVWSGRRWTSWCPKWWGRSCASLCSSNNKIICRVSRATSPSWAGLQALAHFSLTP